MKSGKVNFLSVQHCVSRSAYKIITDLDIVKHTYDARVFEIDSIFGNNKFNIQNLKTLLLTTKLQIYYKYEHMGIVERSTRTIK